MTRTEKRAERARVNAIKAHDALIAAQEKWDAAEAELTEAAKAVGAEQYRREAGRKLVVNLGLIIQ